MHVQREIRNPVFLPVTFPAEDWDIDGTVSLHSSGTFLSVQSAAEVISGSDAIVSTRSILE